MSKTFKIDGALYHTIERSTLANDFYVMQQLRRAGIADCTPRGGETANDYALRLLYSIIDAGAPFELLGGLLLPEGIPDEKWTVEQAETTAAVLRQVTDPADKAEIQKILIAVMTDFFCAGLRYLKPSPDASAQAPEKEASTSSVADFSQTSASGGTSSANSPITRSTDTSQ